MHRLLLAAAVTTAALIVSSPAAAQSFESAGFGSSLGSTRVNVVSGQRGSGDFDRRHGHHRRNENPFGGFFSSGYNDFGDYDANRSFDPDKWNDWWHERPERSFPRWMSRNQDCSRQWYSGDVLTC